MGTKTKLSTKALSFFLSVLMAVSCFGIVLPNLAPEAANAAASEDQWDTLKNALIAAVNGGYLGTATYTVHVDENGNASVNDSSKNGYLYNVVKAVGAIAQAEGTEAPHAHNALLGTFICDKLDEMAAADENFTVTGYAKDFIKAILPCGPGTKYEAYDGSTDLTTWNGSAADLEANLPANYSFTTSVVRGVKGAVLSDYDDAADVPAEVDVRYQLTFSANRVDGDSTVPGQEKSARYENASVVESTTKDAAPDLSSIIAYNRFVMGVQAAPDADPLSDADKYAPGFAAGFAAYGENPDSVYFEDADVLVARYDVYVALQAAANANDGDYVERFIGADNMNAFFNYAKKAHDAARAVLAKRYVDWIGGLPLGDGSINRDDYDENDHGRIEALILQAQSYLEAVNALSADVREVMTNVFGYEQSYQLTKDIFPIDGKEYFTLQQTAVDNGDGTQSVSSAYVAATATAENIATLYERVTYANYIRDMQNKLERADLKVIRDAADALMKNDESYTYTFPAGSLYSTFYRTSDTEAVEGKTYYENVNGSWKAVSESALAEAESFENFYEVSAVEMTGVGNDCFVSQPYQEQGETCPVDYLTLSEDIAWFEGAVAKMNAANPGNLNAVISAEDQQAIRDMLAALQAELEYRDFDDQPGSAAETFRTEYAWFVNAMATKKIAFMSTEVLLGYSYVETDPDTGAETTVTVPAFLTTANNHFTALQNALNELSGTSEVKARYQSFVNTCQEWTNSIYGVLYHRVYDDVDRLYKDAGSRYDGVNITAANFAIVKAEISNLDEVFDDLDEPWPGEETSENPLPPTDERTRGIQNTLYTWLCGSTVKSNVIAKVPEATNATYTHMQNVVGTDTIKAYLNKCDQVMAGGWASWTRYYNDTVTYTGGKLGTAGVAGTNNAGNTGIYTVRDGRIDDMVRKDDNRDYVVTDDRINTVINALDRFAASQQFVKLIGQYDEANGVTDLKTFLTKILTENLFNDDMVNTIVALLFPMVTDMIYDLLNSKLNGLVIDGYMLTAEQPTVSNALASIKLKQVFAMLNLSGAGYTITSDDKCMQVYGDGEKDTITFANAFAALGLNIFPQQFASSLPNTVNGKSMSTFKSYLNAGINRWGKMDADADGEVKKEDLAAKGAVWGVHDFDTFCTAIGAVFNSILPLLKAVFANYGFTSSKIEKFLYVEVDSNTDVIAHHSWLPDVKPGIGGTNAYGDVQISLTGVQGYNNVWGPIFEALGISETTSGYGVNDFTVNTPLSTSFGTSGNNANYQQFTRALFMPIWALVDRLSSAPFATLMGILPTVAYDLAYNMVTPLLNTLETTIHLNVQLRELDIKGGVVAWLLDIFATPLQNKLNNDVLPSLIPDIPLNVGSLLNFRDLLGMDITNLNDIVKFIIGKVRSDDVSEQNTVNVPPINTARIGGLGDKETLTSIRTNDQSGAGAGHRYYVTADRPDVLYEIIQLLLTFVAKEGNLSGLVANFSSSGLGSVGDILEPILGAIDTEDAIAALVELFEPQKYDMTPYEWYQPNSAASTYNFGSAFDQANFAYLKYQNDWTRAKAQ